MIESHTDQNAGSCFSVINVAISFCSCFAIMINKGVSMFQLSSNWVPYNGSMVMTTMRQKWSLSKEDLYIKLQNNIKQIKDEIYQSFFN